MRAQSVLLASKTWEIGARLFWPTFVAILCHLVERASPLSVVEVAVP
jgi:hypothetical protein